MCTCICLKTKDHYFGRNLDLDYRFGEKVVITPRNYLFRLKNRDRLCTRYSMIGMAATAEGYPLYAEASNEKGLSMAGLYFPGNACYFDEKEDRLNLAPYELIPYFLGQYETIDQIREAIGRLNITNLAFADNLPLTELHWMMWDKRICIVLEQTKDGLKCFDNPVGVLTNNPPFDYHLTNLCNYMELSPCDAANSFSDKIDLRPYGLGMGAIGLPGDSSPASRFVRAAFNKLNSVCGEDEESSVTQFFHILDSVAMVRGATLTKEGKPDITTYSCCINADRGIFYYKTYTNSRITAVRMAEAQKRGKQLSVYPLTEAQQFQYAQEPAVEADEP